MTGDAALGIDVGTSGVRAALLAPDGDVLGLGTAPIAPENRRNPAAWAASLSAALAALFDEAPASRVGAVAVDGTSGTVLALDGAGDPIGDAAMYDDAVDDPAIPKAIAAVAPRESAAHGAASGLARSIFLQDRAGCARIVHQADWVASLLAGAPMPTDESNALKTGYDPILRAWPDWLAKTTLRLDLLPEVRPAGAQTGETSGAFGLPSSIPMVAGVTDGCASFLATGAQNPGDGVTALGTTLVIKLLSDVPIFAPERGIYSHRIGSKWLAGGASNTGGGVLAGLFSKERLAALSDLIDPTQDSGFDYYPLSRPGERFPISDPALPPRITPRPDDDAAYLHGILEGMARIEALGYRRLADLGAPPLQRLWTVGGGAKNDTWTALRLRILDVDAAPAVSEEASVGVARLALAHLCGEPV